MKHSRIFCLLIILSLAIFLSACSTRPTAMIQQAEEARTEAAAEHAELFAPDDWSAAESDWKAASEKVDAKSYGEANTLLLKAKTRYDKAKSLAKGKRETAEKDLAAAQTTANIRLKKDLKENPAVQRLSAARKSALDGIVKEIEDSISKVTTLVQNGQYEEARVLIGNTQRRIWEVQQEYFK